ncbi:MAG: hypothetical protein V3T40_03560 [Nitrososphaerales archaeon]
MVIQYLALGLRVTGVVLSLSYPQTLANRLRLAITSKAKETEEIKKKADDATTKIECHKDG